MKNNCTKHKYKLYLCIIILLILVNSIFTLKLVFNYRNKKNSNKFKPAFNTTLKSNKDKNKKYVYLTFDDGPTYVVTDQILDVLKKNNIKATFFIVGKEIPEKEHILTRIHEEGHSIGLHTYSHDAKKIYSNKENFIKEMTKTQKKIEDLLGFKSKIIRCPWGIHNIYNKLGSSLINEIHKNDLKIYDWNCSLEDGLNPNLSTKRLFDNSKIVKEGYNNNVIILAHCNFNNKNTVKVLPKIIKYYKNLGYEFKPITESTPEYYIESKCNKNLNFEN